MNGAKRTPQSIDEIIHSFKHYGLGDIIHNKGKTIPVFILSICFIDQLASFRYRIKADAERWEQFIEDYMHIYSELKIYNNFRNTLIHNYSSCRKFGLTNDPSFTFPFSQTGSFVTINTDIFVENLETAFMRFKEDISVPNSEANYTAIKRSITHPVLTFKEID